MADLRDSESRDDDNVHDIRNDQQKAIADRELGDRADSASIDDQCRALTSEGERCQNAVSYMTDDPFCGPHSRADDVETIDDVLETDGGQPEYRIENARVVGGEYRVKLAILTEYEFPVIAGHHESDAIDVARELALHSNLEKTKPAERDVIHSDVERLRDIYEDDVEAGQLEFMDEPTAPSPDTYWDDSRHFDLEDGREIRTDGGTPQTARSSHWRPRSEREQTTCQNCGSKVSRQFARVSGDNDDVPHACPECAINGQVHRKASNADGGEA